MTQQRLFTPLHVRDSYGPGYEKWTEAQFQSVLKKDLGPLHGWIHSHHETFSMGTKPGFPDLTMWNPFQGGVIFLEVKGPRNKVYVDQVETLETMRRAGMHAYVVRPVDLPLCEAIFRSLPHPPAIGTGRTDPRLDALLAHELDPAFRRSKSR